MSERGSPGSARQDELLQRRKFAVERLEQALEALDRHLGDDRVAGDGDLAAEIEKVVLHADERVAHLAGQLLREQHAERRVQLIDLAERSDARARLRDARAVAEAGLTRIAGTGRDLGEAMTHRALVKSGGNYSMRPRALLSRRCEWPSPSLVRGAAASHPNVPRGRNSLMRAAAGVSCRFSGCRPPSFREAASA